MSPQLDDQAALRRLVIANSSVLEGAHPLDVLAWAGEAFGPGLVVASSMGDEVLVHLASRAVPGVDVIFLDTGYHFAETLATRDAYAATTDIALRTLLPLQTVAEQDLERGPQLYGRDPNLCCALRKVEPLERGLAPYRAWITGMRREDAPTRTDIAVVGWYAEAHDVLLNPLRRRGYTSIGCAPCTRVVAPGEDPRAGRWADQEKTECGLHS